MTPAQIRAARAALNWSQKRLAAEAGIHAKAVAYWERDARQVTRHPESGAVPRMKDALERHGVTVSGATISLPMTPSR